MDTQKKIVLLIEDDTQTRSILLEKLQASGFVTYQAQDGEEGLQLSLEHHPDIILLDLLMPKMDGMTVLTKLREDSWGKNVPVIILTNLSADADKTLKSIITTQPAYYLVKSDIKLDDVIEKINNVLASPEKTQ